MGREGQRATAGRLTKGSSLNGAMVSSVMYLARWTAHSSFCSSSKAPTRRTMASSLGKMPTTSVLRLISPLMRSIGLIECRLARCSLGKVMKASTSCSASHDGSDLGHLGPDLVGDGAPLGAGGLGRLLGEGGGNEGRDDAAA